MLFITKNKKSDYRIVIPADTTPSVNTAAQELQKYICDISGAYLPIVCDCKEEQEKEICIGYTNRDSGICPCEAEKLGDEGYIIKTFGEKLFIYGSDVRGALYGVYTFLEKFCNCRFYTFEFERVPKDDEITVPDASLREVPVLEYRNAYWFSQSQEFISAKLKNNGWMGHDLTERVGGGIAYNGDFCHTLGYLSGLVKKGEGCWENPCLNDEEVYKTTLANVKADLREHPERKIISVSQLDGTEGECQCEKCKAVTEEEGSPAGNLIRFCNRLQDDIKDEFPDVRIDTLAYRFSRFAPKKAIPHEDMIVRLCNIECCFRHPLYECNDDPIDEKHFTVNLKKWSEISNHLYIWDYTTNFTNCSVPFPNFGAMRKNVRYFVDNGVTGIFEQGNIASYNGEWGALRGYILCKLLWNPYMTEGEYRGLIEEFMDDYYGRGSEQMKELLKIEHECTRNGHFGVYFDSTFYSMEYPYATNSLEVKKFFLEKAFSLFEAAEAAAANQPVCLANIRRAKIQAHNLKWFLQTDLEDEAKEAGDEARYEAELAERARNNQIQFGLMRDYGVTCNREFSELDFTKEPKDWTSTPIFW